MRQEGVGEKWGEGGAYRNGEKKGAQRANSLFEFGAQEKDILNIFFRFAVIHLAQPISPGARPRSPFLFGVAALEELSQQKQKLIGDGQKLNYRHFST